ncbi:MAG: hypothetical protein IPL91_12170 [Hyphomicrobium sp.]|nr:hypothetical protein [Hyphomicrobium sp.]
MVLRRLRGMLRTVVALGAAAFVLASAEAAEPPRRIVSLNLCTDQLLLDLVEPERIAGVSYLATDPTLSADAVRLEPFKKLKGTAEEVLALHPDLVIAGEYTTGATVDLLRRLGQEGGDRADGGRLRRHARHAAPGCGGCW